MGSYSFKPIGFVRCAGQYKFEAPRQGVFSSSDAIVELESCYGGDAISDLAGFERIWVIFLFNRNVDAAWKARVMPPCAPERRKYSIFATRSPYRPNPVGLSCVKLERIDGCRLFISNHDLLDGTPVLDIKPYIPEADAFPDAAAGWRDHLALPEWKIEYGSAFMEKAALLLELGAPDMVNFCEVQLVRDPLNRERRRIFALPGGEWEIGCRTWRLRFTAFPDELRIVMSDIRSNYRDDELTPGSVDRYADKELHRAFLRKFPRAE